MIGGILLFKLVFWNVPAKVLGRDAELYSIIFVIKIWILHSGIYQHER